MPAKFFERFEISTARYKKGNYFARLLIAISSGLFFFYFGNDSPLFTPSAILHLLFLPLSAKKERMREKFFLAPLSTHTQTHMQPSGKERDGEKESGELIRTKRNPKSVIRNPSKCATNAHSNFVNISAQWSQNVLVMLNSGD